MAGDTDPVKRAWEIREHKAAVAVATITIIAMIVGVVGSATGAIRIGGAAPSPALAAVVAGPTATPSSTAAPTPTPSSAGAPTGMPTCPLPPTVNWDNDNQGHNGYAKSTLSLSLDDCSTLMVASGQITLPDQTVCGYQADQVCVLIIQVTHGRPVEVRGLIKLHTWYGITRSPADQALADKRQQFFGFGNCSPTGCSVARVWTYIDGVPQPYQEIRP